MKKKSSFSEVAKRKSSIILLPKNDKQSVSITKKDLLSKIDTIKSNVGISAVKSGRHY
jgi:hypothetical protein